MADKWDFLISIVDKFTWKNVLILTTIGLLLWGVISINDIKGIIHSFKGVLK